MQRASVEILVRRFNEAGVRYLIAGGFAVVAHGYTRFTVDLDFILDLEPENAAKALEILKDEGYAPTIPVPINNSPMRSCAKIGRRIVIWSRFRCKAKGTGKPELTFSCANRSTLNALMPSGTTGRLRPN